MSTASLATAAPSVPEVDARGQDGRDGLTPEQCAAFRANGLLVIRGLLRGAELKALQDQTLPWVEKAMAHPPVDGQPPPFPEHRDIAYKPHAATGKITPFNIGYLIDKEPACKSLLGHPFILRSVERLQGRNLVPTWDSMVFKTAGQGAAIPWHRDASPGDPSNHGEERPVFNVDFYLDRADLSNCLWGIPGSNRWPEARARAEIERLNRGGFSTDGALPITMEPGDVILHNILVLHGSPAAQTALRRVLYYEFRPADLILKYGSHTAAYIPPKQKVLLACLRHRAASPFSRGETPFAYCPEAPWLAPTLAADEELPTYRFAHEDFRPAKPVG